MCCIYVLYVKQYPETCGKFVVKSVRDLTTGYDSSQPDGKAVSSTSNTSYWQKRLSHDAVEHIVFTAVLEWSLKIDICQSHNQATGWNDPLLIIQGNYYLHKYQIHETGFSSFCVDDVCIV